MECSKCQLYWDYGDPDPPECGVARRQREVVEWSDKKTTLRQRWAELKQTLLRKDEMKFPLKLVTLPHNSWPELGTRAGLYQLRDGRPVLCSTENPHAASPQIGLPEKPIAGRYRYYTVFGLDGSPQTLVLSMFTGEAVLLVADMTEFRRTGTLAWTKPGAEVA